MMQHITPEIVERVNRFFGYGAVARVTIRQGEVAVAKPRVAPPSLKVPSLEPATLDLGDSLRSIADPELKAVLESLAAGVASTHGPPVFDNAVSGVHAPVAGAALPSQSCSRSGERAVGR